MFLTVDNEDKIINSLWHGISPNANADRIWMPSGHSKGDLAIADDEIVIDAHVVDVLDLSIGDEVTISASGAIR